MNQQHIDNQREKINDARRSGELKLAIYEKLIADDRITTRQDVITYICDVLDMCDNERYAMHDGSKSYLSSAIDYCVCDLNAGVHGEKYENSIILGNGIWTLSEEFDVDISTIVVSDFAPKVSLKKQRAELRLLISEFYVTLDADLKQRFKKNGGTMQLVIDACINDSLAIDVAVSSFL